MRSMDPPMRAFLGFLAGALSVLIFHQSVWALFHLGGLMPPPYPMSPVPPWSVPLTIDFCFWGGIYGLIYGLLLPRFTTPLWLSGLILGVIATLVLWFIVAPIKGRPLASGWVPRTMLVVLIIHVVWGLGVGLILRLVDSRAPLRA
jgi:hypothetical protein